MLLLLVQVGPGAAFETDSARGEFTALKKDDCGKSKNLICFDHLVESESRSYSLKLKPGETFSVLILNTDPTQFSYELDGLLRDSLAVSAQEQVQGPSTTLVDVPLEAAYSSKFAGYLVHRAQGRCRWEGARERTAQDPASSTSRRTD